MIEYLMQQVQKTDLMDDQVEDWRDADLYKVLAIHLKTKSLVVKKTFEIRLDRNIGTEAVVIHATFGIW